MTVPRERIKYRRRRLAAVAALALAVAAIAVVAFRGGEDDPKRLVPGAGTGSGDYDPLAFDEEREDELARRAAAGFSDVLYEKSPGGVIASARRTARWRKSVERAASAQDVDPDTLEAVVFLESAGRSDAIAGGDLEGAVGLTQILASTATSLLGMRVDLARSRSLTARIGSAATATAARRLERTRRQVDERFDPDKSIAGAARYLKMARDKFGREDLAVATYHMGMGNLETFLSRYRSDGGDDEPSYTRLYFDTAPVRRPRAYALLSSLGDDSSNYWWRVSAAREIMRLSRSDQAGLAKRVALDEDAGAGARRLYPGGAPDSDSDARTPPKYGKAVALRFTGDARSDFAPDKATEAVLVYIGAGVRRISGQSPLTVTAAHGIRLETSRHYVSRKQALAFQYMLDRLQAWNLIAWGRAESTIAIVVGPDAAKVLPSPDKLRADAARAYP